MAAADSKDTLRISVKISGREFAMTILKKDEEKYRRGAKDVNALISEYKSAYAAEAEEYLAMAALQLAVDKVTLEMDRTMSDQMAEIDNIGREIDHYLEHIKE